MRKNRQYNGMTYANNITIGSRSVDVYLDREAASQLCKCLINFLNSRGHSKVELRSRYIAAEEPMIVGHGRGKGARIRPNGTKGFGLTITNLP